MVSKQADLIQGYYPGLRRSEAFNVIAEVRKLNHGKLVGLKMHKFLKLMRSLMERATQSDVFITLFKFVITN